MGTHPGVTVIACQALPKDRRVEAQPHARVGAGSYRLISVASTSSPVATPKGIAGAPGIAASCGISNVPAHHVEKVPEQSALR